MTIFLPRSEIHAVLVPTSAGRDWKPALFAYPGNLKNIKGWQEELQVGETDEDETWHNMAASHGVKNMTKRQKQAKPWWNCLGTALKTTKMLSLKLQNLAKTRTSDSYRLGRPMKFKAVAMWGQGTLFFSWCF